MRRLPKYALVHSDAGWFVRKIARNGKEEMRASEVYTERRGAFAVIEREASDFGGFIVNGGIYTYVDDQGRIDSRVLRARVVEVDERRRS
jgi:hypothetical protein